MFFFSTGLTVSYSFRLFYYCFILNLNFISINLIFDLRFIIQKSIVSLLIFAVIGGSFLNWLIFPFTYFICLTFFIKILTLLICFLGGSLGFLISLDKLFSRNKSLNFYFFSSFFSVIWFIPFLCTIGINRFPLKLRKALFKSLDQGWLEFFGVQLSFNFFLKFSVWNQFIQFNHLKIYLNFFIFWIIFLFFLLF